MIHPQRKPLDQTLIEPRLPAQPGRPVGRASTATDRVTPDAWRGLGGQLDRARGTVYQPRQRTRWPWYLARLAVAAVVVLVVLVM